MTFMNLSGRSVTPCSRFFDVPPDNILVAHDELDLAYGDLRLKSGGGHAGHNGLRSMVGELGKADFLRLRIGIGRPQKGSVSNYVLSDFSAGEERDWLPDLIDRSVSAIRSTVRDGIRRAMNEVNTRA
jgi:PTH1 family peptidyl-tRNA hydrolase